MEEKNMTALVCCFARAYHNKNSNIKIYEDNLAEKILSKEEYDNISINMSNGIKFINNMLHLIVLILISCLIVHLLHIFE